MTPAELARRRRDSEKEAKRKRLESFRQHLTPGQTLVDHRGQAYEVQPDGSIRRVVLQPKAQA